MSKNFYMHIGAPKTGTTVLQIFCDKHRDLLAKKYHLLYPRHVYADGKGGAYTLANNQEIAHHFAFILKEQHTERIWEKLAKQAQEHPECDVLLSSELFLMTVGSLSKRDPAKRGDVIRRFKSLVEFHFPGYQPKLILYVRRLDDYTKSVVNQWVKQARYRGIKEYHHSIYNLSMRDWYKRIYSGPAVTSPENIRELKSIFGSKNVIVKLYDRTRFKNNNILYDFFATFGIDISSIDPAVEKTNDKIPDSALPYLHMLHSTRHKFSAVLEQEWAGRITDIFSHEPFTQPLALAESLSKSYIEDMDREVPGYKSLFEAQPFSSRFAEAHAEPKDVLLFELLLSLIESTARLEEHVLKKHMDPQERRIRQAMFENQLLLACGNADDKHDETILLRTPWNDTKHMELCKTHDARLCFTSRAGVGRSSRCVHGLVLQNREKLLLGQVLTRLGFQDPGIFAYADSFQDFRGMPPAERESAPKPVEVPLAYCLQKNLILPGQYLLGMIAAYYITMLHEKGTVLLMLRDLRFITVSYLFDECVREGKNLREVENASEMMLTFLRSHLGKRILFYAGEWVKLLDYTLVVRYEELVSGERAIMSKSLASLSKASGISDDEIYSAVQAVMDEYAARGINVTHQGERPEFWTEEVEALFHELGLADLNKALGYK